MGIKVTNDEGEPTAKGTEEGIKGVLFVTPSVSAGLPLWVLTTSTASRCRHLFITWWRQPALPESDEASCGLARRCRPASWRQRGPLPPRQKWVSVSGRGVDA